MECMTLTRRRDRVQDLLTCFVCVDFHEVLHHALFDFVNKYNPNQPPFVALLVINSGVLQLCYLTLTKKNDLGVLLAYYPILGYRLAYLLLRSVQEKLGHKETMRY